MADQSIQNDKDQKPEAIDLSKAKELAKSTETGQAQTPSTDELQLERFGNNVQDVEDEVMEDDDDDEDNHIAHHPLLGMLAGRLGQPRRRGSTHKYDSLHPVTSVLTVSDVDGCVQLESSFPENERASREKFEYRLSRCPELSLGIFTQPTKSEASGSNKTSKRQLVAMIIATRTPAPSVTDASMEFPKDWRSKKQNPVQEGQDEPVGHQEIGGTVALHSLAVAAEHRNKGLATILMKSYIQRIRESKIADRIALLAHDELTGFYSGLGFDNMGPSACKHGGGGWNTMVLEFSDLHDE